jgi:hypothetical protein
MGGSKIFTEYCEEAAKGKYGSRKSNVLFSMTQLLLSSSNSKNS